jgi:hypothetical protein
MQARTHHMPPHGFTIYTEHRVSIGCPWATMSHYCGWVAQLLPMQDVVMAPPSIKTDCKQQLQTPVQINNPPGQDMYGALLLFNLRTGKSIYSILTHFNTTDSRCSLLWRSTQWGLPTSCQISRVAVDPKTLAYFSHPCVKVL